MSRTRLVAIVATMSLATLLFLSIVATAQVKTEGLITGRSGDTLTLQTSDSSKIVVVLTDDTQVSQVQGVLKARRKQMSMAALIPGLPVQVEGRYNAQNQLVATSIKFKGNDLEHAQSAQAGLQPTKQALQQSQEELAQQKAALDAQQQALAQQQAHMAEAQAKIAANMAAIKAANERFGQLGEYNILDEVTVYFANGKVALDPEVQTPAHGVGRESQGYYRLHYSGGGLCFLRRQCCTESEAERRPGQQCHHFLATAGSRSPYAHAGARGHG